MRWLADQLACPPSTLLLPPPPQVMGFWGKAQRIVVYKARTEADARKKLVGVVCGGCGGWGLGSCVRVGGVQCVWWVGCGWLQRQTGVHCSATGSSLLVVPR